MSKPLYDIGANLTHNSYTDDLDAVLQRAAAEGVNRLAVTGSSVEASEQACALAQRYPALVATAGVHPHHASDYTPASTESLRELLANPQVRAVGETGLDYYRNYSTVQQQEHAFREQLQLAADTAMPVFLHQRDAHGAFMDILREYRERLGRGVVHCFTGSAEELRDYLDLDMHIGITGWICDERRGAHLHELVPLIPHNRLLLETDCPYLLPRDLKPTPKTRRNEPRWLGHIARTVAACRNESPDELAAQTTANAEAFFARTGVAENEPGEQ